jgi:hypothetical protein
MNFKFYFAFGFIDSSSNGFARVCMDSPESVMENSMSHPVPKYANTCPVKGSREQSQYNSVRYLLIYCGVLLGRSEFHVTSEWEGNTKPIIRKEIKKIYKSTSQL